MAVDALTRREREVLELVADGWTLAEAATRLGLSRCYCKNLCESARRKLGAASTTHACVLLIRRDVREALG